MNLIDLIVLTIIITILGLIIYNTKRKEFKCSKCKNSRNCKFY